MKQTSELIPAPQRDLPVVRHDESALTSVNIGALLDKAIDAKSAVEVMERLQAMRREIKAEHAKAAYDAALAAFQAECPIIQKHKQGARNAYKYAPLDDIILQVRDLLLKHGFSFSITSEVEKDWVKAVCKITHRDGHSESSEFKVPVDNRNTMMNDPQRYAGSLTFTKRYSFCNALGILTCDEDNDGGSRPKPPGPSTIAGDGNARELIKELWTVLVSIRGTAPNWASAKQWLVDENVITPEEHGGDINAPQLPPDRLRQIINHAKERLAK